jgi:hypothetical protein
MKRVKKQTLLLGEGIHQHTLYGDFKIADDFNNSTDTYAEVIVDKESLLKHEHPSGSFGEHKTLVVEKGNWVMGKQVEYNPFSQKIDRVWD